MDDKKAVKSSPALNPAYQRYRLRFKRGNIGIDYIDILAESQGMAEEIGRDYCAQNLGLLFLAVSEPMVLDQASYLAKKIQLAEAEATATKERAEAARRRAESLAGAQALGM